MSQVFTSAILIVGSYYQLGTLPDFTEEFKKSLGNDVLKESRTRALAELELHAKKSTRKLAVGTWS